MTFFPPDPSESLAAAFAEVTDATARDVSETAAELAGLEGQAAEAVDAGQAEWADYTDHAEAMLDIDAGGVDVSDADRGADDIAVPEIETAAEEATDDVEPPEPKDAAAGGDPSAMTVESGDRV